jgi:branched-chain amino acid aminotransferase
MTASPQRFVHWNGEIVPAEAARASVFDTGFLYGDGIYETMRSYEGRVFALDRHLRRLERSAASVALELPARADLSEAIQSVIRANGCPDCIVRMTVTRGSLGRRLDLSSSGPPSVLVISDPIEPGIDERNANGIRVVFSRYLRHSTHPLAGVKSTNYQVSLFARNEAREAGAQEVLIPNESGEIVEAAAANVFYVEGGRLLTPPLGSGILGGITREVVIELAGARGLAVAEKTLPRQRVESVDELFLTGTTIRIAPVIQVGDRVLRDGRPGPVAAALLADYLAAVRTEVLSSEPDVTSERMR